MKKLKTVITALFLFMSFTWVQQIAGQSHLISETERKMASVGLVDISGIDTTIQVMLVYAAADNFVGEVLYEDLKKAYLHPDAAQALVKAQRLLAWECPGCRIVVYDAARPMSVQQKMKDKVRGTPMDKYVSDPANGGGLHNYGLAVDVSIVDKSGRPLPMGTDFDHLGPESNIDREAELVADGRITAAERANRELLRRVMSGAGFTPLRSEWWHFNLRSRAEARAGYKVID